MEQTGLFRLIKSLNKSEKRYFKLYARHYENSSNIKIRLFDAIDKLDRYNEQKIRTFFAGEIFLKQLAVTENHLYYLILKCLHNYNSGKSVDSELREMLDYIEALFKKGLYGECLKLIAKAKKKAQLYEKHPLIFEIIRWERMLFI